MSEIEKEIDSVMAELNSPITSIPGIGNLLGATILSEIGDIKNFNNPDKLLAFAGCEPSTYQSGKYTASNTPMVKHGSRYLRRALYCAADMAYVNSISFRTYIDRKRAPGEALLRCYVPRNEETRSDYLRRSFPQYPLLRTCLIRNNSIRKRLSPLFCHALFLSQKIFMISYLFRLTFL